MVGLRCSSNRVSRQIALGKISLAKCGLITTLEIDHRPQRWSFDGQSIESIRAFDSRSKGVRAVVTHVG